MYSIMMYNLKIGTIEKRPTRIIKLAKWSRNMTAKDHFPEALNIFGAAKGSSRSI